MLSFKRPAASERSGGAKLPMPLKALDKLDVSLRRSELSMIAGVPGAGKSSLALVLALRSVVPTLYVAADTSEWTMRTRTLASISGEPQALCERALLGDLDPAAFDAANHIAWCFDPAPTVDQIRMEIDAYSEVHGLYPELIVVDNLIDVAGDGHGRDEWGNLRATMKDLKVLARDTDASVLVLHHVSEGGDKWSKAPGRAAIQGKVAQLPALVMTVDSVAETQTMSIGVVKNRYGMAAANGSYGCALNFDATRMQITDPVIRF